MGNECKICDMEREGFTFRSDDANMHFICIECYSRMKRQEYNSDYEYGALFKEKEILFEKLLQIDRKLLDKIFSVKK